MVTFSLKAIITNPKILNIIFFPTINAFFSKNDKNREKNLNFHFLILDNDHKSFDNPIQKKKLKKIMQFIRYVGFSILSPWCFYQKSNSFKT